MILAIIVFNIVFFALLHSGTKEKLDRVFVEYVITSLWARAGSYYIGYVSSWT
jgi:hypothetical protein